MRARGALRQRLAFVILAMVVVSASLALPVTWLELDQLRDAFGDMSTLRRERRAGVLNELDSSAWDFARAHVRKGDTYLIVTHGRRGDGTTRDGITRAYASYWLLPAVQVSERERADVLIFVRADPFVDADPPPDAACETQSRSMCVKRLRG